MGPQRTQGGAQSRCRESGPPAFYAMWGAARCGLSPQARRRGRESSQRGRIILSWEETGSYNPGDGEPANNGHGEESPPHLLFSCFVFWGFLGPCSFASTPITISSNYFKGLVLGRSQHPSSAGRHDEIHSAGGEAPKQQIVTIPPGAGRWGPRSGCRQAQNRLAGAEAGSTPRHDPSEGTSPFPKGPILVTSSLVTSQGCHLQCHHAGDEALDVGTLKGRTLVYSNSVQQSRGS